MIINFNEKNKEGKGKQEVLEDPKMILDITVRKGLTENGFLKTVFPQK